MYVIKRDSPWLGKEADAQAVRDLPLSRAVGLLWLSIVSLWADQVWKSLTEELLIMFSIQGM